MTTSFYAALGRRIREMREKHGWSQAQLAEMVSTSHAAISRYEQGRHGMTLEVLQAISHALGVSPWELLSFDEPMPFRPSKRRPKATTTRGPRTKDEQELLRIFASLTPRWRAVMLGIARVLARESRKPNR